MFCLRAVPLPAFCFAKINKGVHSLLKESDGADHPAEQIRTGYRQSNNKVSHSEAQTAYRPRTDATSPSNSPPVTINQGVNDTPRSPPADANAAKQEQARNSL